MAENKPSHSFFTKGHKGFYFCSYHSCISYLNKKCKRDYDDNGYLYYSVKVPKYIVKKYDIKSIIHILIEINFTDYLNKLTNNEEIPYDVKVYMFYNYLFGSELSCED